MLVNQKILNKIIKESINEFLLEDARYIAVGGSDNWEGYKDGYEGKMKRMHGKGVNTAFDAAMEKLKDRPKKTYTINPPSYNEWSTKFRHMPYSEYVEKRKNSEI